VSIEGRIPVALLLLLLARAAWPDWRQPDPANLLYVQLPRGVIVIELAAEFAPQNIANIKVLAREKYFDGLAIVRSQDNYVAQWADPAEETDQARSLGSAATTVSPEFQRAAEEVEMSTLDSRDAYADIVGFVDGFPAGSDGKHVWLAHCYGMVGVARGNAPDSGNGSSLYVVTGHAPRHLDRNITLVGRVISGIENLSTLPRGSGALGFYESRAEMTPILGVRLGTEVAETERIQVEIMRTDSAEFSDYVKSRTTRTEEWFVEPTGRIGICNVKPPQRVAH
jgi:cyclophilin family peptidyl-prolyl cis-trans isomerase